MRTMPRCIRAFYAPSAVLPTRLSSTWLGRDGPTASRIGLGLAALGRPGYITLGRDEDLPADRGVEALRRRTGELLDAAYAAGVRYFDVARSYGRAEGFLADWLDRRRLGPAQVTVGSKWGYIYTAGWRVDADRHEIKDHSLGTLRCQLAESRRLLGDRLALYQATPRRSSPASSTTPACTPSWPGSATPGSESL